MAKKKSLADMIIDGSYNGNWNQVEENKSLADKIIDGTYGRDFKPKETIYKSKMENNNPVKEIFSNLIKEPEILKDNNRFLDDGYQFGDLTRIGVENLVDNYKVAGSTIANGVGSIAKGAIKISEDSANLLAAGVAQIGDSVFGQKEWADRIRKDIAENPYQILPLIDGLNEKTLIDKHSAIGSSGEEVLEGIGQTLGYMALAEVNPAVSTGAMFASGAGGSLAESYGKENVEDYQVWLKALGSGAIETFSEKLFGFFGETGLDEALANNISKKLTSGLAKTLARSGIKATSEAAEEFISYTSNYFLDNIINSVSKGKGADFSSKWDWNDVLKQMGYAALSTIGLDSATTVHGISKARNEGNLTTKEAINDYARKIDSENGVLSENEQKIYNTLLENKTTEVKTQKKINEMIESQKETLKNTYNRDLTDQEVQEITQTIEAIKENGKLNINETELSKEEKTKLEKEIKEDLEDGNISIETIRNILGDNTDISKDYLLQRSVYEDSQKYESYKFEATDNEKVNRLLQSAADSGINNTSKTRKMVDIISRLVQNTDRQYRFVNQEQLKELGYNESANGLNNNGEILLSVNSKKQIEAVVGHETTHLFDSKVNGEYTEEYKELQQAVTNYLKSNGTYESKVKEIMNTYTNAGINLNQDQLMEELTADTIGDNLFGENAEEFVKQLTTNKTVFQRIYDYIKKAIRNIAGYKTEEAKQLQNLKDTFDKVYKTLNNSEIDTSTKYSIGGIRAIENIKSNPEQYNSAINSYNEALKMIKENKTNKEIFKKTGWFRGDNGKLKFNFSDADIKLINQQYDTKKIYKLEDILEHKTLFEFYPELKEYKVKIRKLGNAQAQEIVEGGFKESEKTILLNKEIMNNQEYAEGTLIHEIQHAIQGIEGFTRGSKSKNRILYDNNKGELEAEDTVRRMIKEKYDKADLSEITPKSANFRYSVIAKMRSSWYDFINKINGSDVHAKSLRSIEGTTPTQENNKANKEGIRNQGINLPGLEETSKVDIDNYGGQKNVYKNKTNLEEDSDQIRTLVDERGRISYSISQDNQGRTLTKEQQDYFKNSKVRDDNGNLLTMYHGTDADFNVFNYDNLGKTGKAYGDGFYFTDSLEGGKSYGNNLKEVYLDIQKPMEIGKRTMSKAEYKSLIEAINEETNGTIVADYGSIEDALMDYEYGGDDIDLINGLRNVSGLKLEKFYNILRNTLGYDGIKANNNSNGKDGNFYIVFNQNQIKNINNTNPSASPDIRYSISEEVKDSNGNILTKEQKEYFKNSKALDDNGNLDTVYHGSNKAGFTIFNRNINFYTNNKEVAQSYTGGTEMVDTRRLESVSDAKSWLKGITEELYITGNSVYDYDGEELLSYKTAEDLLKNLKGDIQKEIGNTEAGGVYEGYVNITKPVIIDAKNEKWSMIDIDNISIDGIENIEQFLKEQGASVWREEGKLRTTTADIASAIYEAVENGDIDADGIIIKNIYDEGGYGNITPTEVGTDYITFNSNQFKASDNKTPTSDSDIRYSLTQGKTNQEWRKLDKDDLIDYNTIESEVGNNGEQQIYSENNGLQERKNEELVTRNTEVHERIAELNRNIKREIRDEQTKLSNLVSEQLNELPISKTKSQKFIRELSNNREMTQDDIYKFLEENNTYIEKEIDDYIKQARKDVSEYSFKLSDKIRAELKQKYDKIPRNIKLKNDGLSVDQIYQELSSKYPDIFSDKIINETDQAIEIIDFVRDVSPITIKENNILSSEELDEASSLIYAYKQVYEEAKDYYNQQYIDEKAKIKDLSPENIIENNTPKKITRKMVKEQIQKEMNITPEELSTGKDIGSINYQLTDPIRVNEKVFGAKLGQRINDLTINKTKHNTAEKIRWQNKEREEIKSLGIKPRSKESAAVQKYAEKQEVLDDNTIKKYGDLELAREFPNKETQEKIKHAAEVLRLKYDQYIDQINEVITSLGYDEIHKRNDYMRHFQELGDVFSKTGVPFNLNDMKAEDLPTDINGLTEFNKPGKNWFAQTQQRYGLRTTYDAITGIDGYLEGAGNLIFHTQDIQNYRALTSMIRDIYGQTKGFEHLDDLSGKELEQRINDIQNNKLSRYVAWLDEQANSLAGKKGAIDRGVERFLGRKGYTFFNTIKQQVGSNMTGFNIRSSLTNLISSTIATAKTNKVALVKGTISTINNMFNNDGYSEKSDFLTSRFGSDLLSKKFWAKVANAGQIFMTGTDYFTSNIINRSKYYEALQKGMSEEESIKYADDFSSRVMGDRSQGATAEAFNSKTLGLFTQFQLEVNNQWQYMIHDSKIDFEKNSETGNGLKAGATMLFQLGQIAAYSYFFNEMFEKLTGSRAAFDPIEILKTLFGLDDDDEEKSFDDRLSEAGAMLVDNIPFGNIFTGGGRIPIAEAFTGISTLGKKLTNQTDKYGNEITWEDVGKDMVGALPYWVLPTGYSQAKKTINGLDLYNKNNSIPGSYTDSGNLRYTVEDSVGSKIQAGIFGSWANPYAQDYIDSGYKTIDKKNIDEMVGLDMNSTEYRKYKQELSKAGSKKEDKLNYINASDLTSTQKDIAANNLDKDSKNKINMKEYGKYNSYDEYNFATKNPEKYSTISAITDYDTYNNFSKQIGNLKKQYSTENGYTTQERKAAIREYIDTLDLNSSQKLMLEHMAAGYSIKEYSNIIQDYLDSTNLETKEKYNIWEQLFN